MIRRAVFSDTAVIAALAAGMWDHSLQKLTDDFTALLKDESAAVYLATENGRAIGFAQCQLRHDYVEGTTSRPVAYLEGVYILPEYRKQGHAAALLQACEAWAREQGCTEFASDCELTNAESLRFHLNTGFREANRIICFVKEI